MTTPIELQNQVITTSSASQLFGGSSLTPLGGGRVLVMWQRDAGAFPGQMTSPTADQVKAKWSTCAQVATLGGNGWTLASTSVSFPWIGPSTAQSAAATSDGNVLVMTGAGGTHPRGYRLLEISGDAITVHDQVDVTIETDSDAASATSRVQATGRLPGTDDFIQVRQTWRKTYIEAVRVSGTSVTVLASADVTGGSEVTGAVIPLDATTALVGLQIFGFNGGLVDHTLDVHRLYKVSLVGGTLSLTSRDVSWPWLPGHRMGLYPSSGSYVAEIIGPDPAITSFSIADDSIAMPLVRRGIAYSGGTFTVTNLPLAPLDSTVVPAGVTGGHTVFPPSVSVVNYPVPIVTDDALLVARATNVIDSSNAATGYIATTAYDRTTGAITGTYWSAGQHPNLSELDAYYDSGVGQLLLSGTDGTTATLKVSIFTSPAIDQGKAGDVRLADVSFNPQAVNDLADGGYVQATRFSG